MIWILICVCTLMVIVLIAGFIFMAFNKTDVVPEMHGSVLMDPVPIDISKRDVIIKSNQAVPEVTEKQQRIPKIIVQTNDVDELPMGILLSIQNIRNYNPEYEHVYFNDKDCDDFIKDNFSKRVYIAFSTLVPGAFRSDFFRTCFLLKRGGVYFDTGFVSFKPLREIIENDDVFICPEDNRRSAIPKNKSENSKKHGYYLHNAMIASIPNHPVLKAHLDIMVNNIETKNYTCDCHSITGPGAIGQAFFGVMGFFDIGTFTTSEGMIKILRSIYYGDMATAVISPEIDIDKVKYNPYFYTKTLTYRDEQKRDSLPYYGKYYDCKQVFGEPGNLPVHKEVVKPKLGKSKAKKFTLSRLISQGYQEMFDVVPKIVDMAYTQKIPKNIIQFTKDKKVSINMYHSILTFIHLNPEYNYYHFYGKSPKEQKSLISTLGGFVIPPEMVCVMPFRDFIDPNVDTVTIDGKILGKQMDKKHGPSQIQTLFKSKNNFSNIEYITDGKEYGGLTNRVLVYTRYHSYNEINNI